LFVVLLVIAPPPSQELEPPTNPGRFSTGFTIRVSQQELADMVGATRKSVNKKLRGWHRAGLVQLGSRLIVITDIPAIEAMA
jgi:CRP-like cAMP-binding protein